MSKNSELLFSSSPVSQQQANLSIKTRVIIIHDTCLKSKCLKTLVNAGKLLFIDALFLMKRNYRIIISLFHNPQGINGSRQWIISIVRKRGIHKLYMRPKVGGGGDTIPPTHHHLQSCQRAQVWSEQASTTSYSFAETPKTRNMPNCMSIIR